MKRTIRRSVFETNSSSTHSITMCSKEDYDKWGDGELYFNRGGWGSLSANSKKQFVTKDEAIEILTNRKYPPDIDLTTLSQEDLDEYFRNEAIYTSEDYWDDEYLETFDSEYTTPTGETVVAFGKYGYDG